MNSPAKPVAERFIRPMAVPSTGLDMDEEAIDRLVAQTGAPSLVHPTPLADDAEQGHHDQAQAARSTRRVREPVTGKATPRTKWGRVTIELPDYLIEELKMRVVKNKSSLRHVIMKALRAQDFTILDADLIKDGRKANGRKPNKV
jgi:hypothetical protein